MKKCLIIFLSFLGLLACQPTSVEADPLNGVWQLSKITFGFPPPNSPAFTTVVKNELYTFDTTKKTFRFSRENVQIETGSYALSEDLKNPNGKDIITFLPDNTFSNYSYLNNKNELVLYQRSKTGGILADGSSFHYSRILPE